MAVLTPEQRARPAFKTMNLYHEGEFQVKVPKSFLTMSKGALQNLLLGVWTSLDKQTQQLIERDFGIENSTSSIRSILQIDAQPLKSTLDVFFERMVAGRLDKSYCHERSIDRKIAVLEYEQILQKNKQVAEQRKSAKKQMTIEFNESPTEGPESSSCSTYDSNFEENEDSEDDVSTVRDIILRHKQSLRNPVSQKGQFQSGLPSKVKSPNPRLPRNIKVQRTH